MENRFKYSVNTNGFKSDVSYRKIVGLCTKVGAEGIEWGLGELEDTNNASREMAKLTQDAGGKTLRVAHPWFGSRYESTLHQRESFLNLMKRARDGLEKLVSLGKEYNIRYVLEMHAGSVAASAPCVRQLMEGLDSKYVGVIYDPANCVVEGLIRPRGAVEILGEYLAYVHAKNLFDRLINLFALSIKKIGSLTENYNADTGEPLYAHGMASWNILADMLYHETKKHTWIMNPIFDKIKADRDYE